MRQNFLQLNQEKTEIVVFGPKKERLEVSDHLDSMSFKTMNEPEIFNHGLRPEPERPHWDNNTINSLQSNKMLKELKD